MCVCVYEQIFCVEIEEKKKQEKVGRSKGSLIPAARLYLPARQFRFHSHSLCFAASHLFSLRSQSFCATLFSRWLSLTFLIFLRSLPSLHLRCAFCNRRFFSHSALLRIAYSSLFFCSSRIHSLLSHGIIFIFLSGQFF